MIPCSVFPRASARSVRAAAIRAAAWPPPLAGEQRRRGAWAVRDEAAEAVVHGRRLVAAHGAAALLQGASCGAVEGRAALHASRAKAADSDSVAAGPAEKRRAKRRSRAKSICGDL